MDTNANGRLAGKVAVIVGGASGFGKATGERFAEEGATVVVLGRRREKAEAAGAELGGIGIECDICNFDQLGAAADQVMATYGHLDVAVNYAGYDGAARIRDITPDHLEPLVEVQFTAAIYFIRHMANAMVASGGGSLISCSSLTAHNPSAGRAGYAGAKAGLEYVTRIAALEYGPDNVRVNAVAPHVIETDMTAPIFQNDLVVESARIQTPLQRMGHVSDVANACLYLASDEAGYVSGETLRIDGAANTQKLGTDLDRGMLATIRPDLAPPKDGGHIPKWYLDQVAERGEVAEDD